MSGFDTPYRAPDPRTVPGTRLVFYAPKPGTAPNPFTAFLAGYLAQRTPYAKQITDLRLQQLDPMRKVQVELALAELAATYASQSRMASAQQAQAEAMQAQADADVIGHYFNFKAQTQALRIAQEQQQTARTEIQAQQNAGLEGARAMTPEQERVLAGHLSRFRNAIAENSRDGNAKALGELEKLAQDFAAKELTEPQQGEVARRLAMALEEIPLSVDERKFYGLYYMSRGGAPAVSPEQAPEVVDPGLYGERERSLSEYIDKQILQRLDRANTPVPEGMRQQENRVPPAYGAYEDVLDTDAALFEDLPDADAHIARALYDLGVADGMKPSEAEAMVYATYRDSGSSFEGGAAFTTSPRAAATDAQRSEQAAAELERFQTDKGPEPAYGLAAAGVLEGLDEVQRDAATRIYRAFAPEFGHEAALGVIANAYHESRLYPDAVNGFDPNRAGVGSPSVGLFQLRGPEQATPDIAGDDGLGTGMSIAERQDADANIARMLEAARKTPGWLAAAASSSDPRELAIAFGRYVERPAEPEHPQRLSSYDALLGGSAGPAARGTRAAPPRGQERGTGGGSAPPEPVPGSSMPAEPPPPAASGSTSSSASASTSERGSTPYSPIGALSADEIRALLDERPYGEIGEPLPGDTPFTLKGVVASPADARRRAQEKKAARKGAEAPAGAAAASSSAKAPYFTDDEIEQLLAGNAAELLEGELGAKKVEGKDMLYDPSTAQPAERVEGKDMLYDPSSATRPRRVLAEETEEERKRRLAAEGGQ